jgi:hypothetical protein
MINEPVRETIEIDNKELFEMMFGNKSEQRKDFMLK